MMRLRSCGVPVDAGGADKISFVPSWDLSVGVMTKYNAHAMPWKVRWSNRVVAARSGNV